MEQKQNYLALGAVVFAAVIVAGLVFSAVAPIQANSMPMMGQNYAATKDSKMAAFSQGSSIIPGYGVDRRLISVSGTVTKTVAPDKAVIQLSVETLEKNAGDSQAKNAELSAKVRSSLKAAGIADEDIKTVSYTLNEEYQWNEFTKKSDIIGYRASNVIEVSVKDITKTGAVIDASVKAGINRISGVTFMLSRENEDKIRADALNEAAASAKDRAQKIASGFGVELGSLYSASESYYYEPVYRNYNFAKDSAGSAPMMAETPITPGDVKVNVSVNAEFEIK